MPVGSWELSPSVVLPADVRLRSWVARDHEGFDNSSFPHGDYLDPARLVTQLAVKVTDQPWHPPVLVNGPSTTYTRIQGPWAPAVAARLRAKGVTVFIVEQDVRSTLSFADYAYVLENGHLQMEGPAAQVRVELEGRQALASVLRATVGYTYTAAEFLEGALPGNPPFTPANITIAGRTVPLVPRHKFNAGVSWSFAPKSRLDALASYVGSQYMDNDQGNTGVKIPTYTVADLKLTWEDRGWRLAAAVNNLFDEKYYNYAVRSTNPLAADRYNAYPLPTRNYSVTMEYTFR